jgi:hypothetical protein
VHAAIKRFEIWQKGLLAARVSSVAGGALKLFNLQAGMGSTLRIGVAAAVINSVIGVAAYLQKSPLLEELN